jgi:Uma2 family endonuclease
MRLLSISDLEFFPTDLPTGPIDYELDDGQLVVTACPGASEGLVQAQLGAELTILGERCGHGMACLRAGIVLRRSPDRLVAPAVMFFCNRSFPLTTSSEGYFRTIPDVIFEVHGLRLSRPQLEKNAVDYLKAGVRLAIVIDPEARTAALHRPNQSAVLLAASDELTCEDIIPGFRLPLANLFADLPPATQ